MIHGYRTIFPNPLAIAATWDPAAAELASRIAASEARAAGIRWTFAPMVDIARYNHLRTGRPATENQYTSKYIDSPNEPLWPFGYGLSYTTFRYAELQLGAGSMTPSGSITVSAAVTNAGERAADEIAQLYIADPVASVARPVKELKGFQRVTLRPGETRRVSFTIARDALEFWDADGWRLEPGAFDVWIGPSSSEGISGRFEVRPERGAN